MKSKHILSAAALALTVLTAGAQTQAPGLWEHTMNMRSQGGEMDKAMAEMQKEMAAMPPEQRKQMEQMMSGRGVSIGPKGTTVKVCISKEQAARPAEPKLADGCTQQVDRRSGNTVRFKFDCTKPEPSSGEGEMTFQSDKAYTGKSTLTTQAKGKAGQQMSMEMSGKWLSADCGDIKPRTTLVK
jgi:hypothetical protein